MIAQAGGRVWYTCVPVCAGVSMCGAGCVRNRHHSLENVAFLVCAVACKYHCCFGRGRLCVGCVQHIPPDQQAW